MYSFAFVCARPARDFQIGRELLCSCGRLRSFAPAETSRYRNGSLERPFLITSGHMPRHPFSASDSRPATVAIYPSWLHALFQGFVPSYRVSNRVGKGKHPSSTQLETGDHASPTTQPGAHAYYRPQLYPPASHAHPSHPHTSRVWRLPG